MKNALIKEKIPLIIILGLYLISFIITWGHCGDLILDCGREAYIPYAIAHGKALYRDIFCIYGPFPYLFNTFFYKIFGANLAILYIIGGTAGAVYTLGIYFSSREFLSKSISVCICALMMYAVIFDTGIFNFIFPYSYAMVFACSMAIWILFCLIKYIKTKKPHFMHICALLWGGICVCKIDFIPVIIPIIAIFLLYEKNKRKEFFKFLLYALIIPAVTYLVLFAQGVAFFDILKNSSYVSQMLKSESLKTFYGNYSLLSFNPVHFRENFIDLIANLFICTIFFLTTLFALRLKRKTLKYILCVFIALFCYIILFLQEEIPQKMFSLAPYICTIIFTALFLNYLRLKDYKNTISVSILTLFGFSLLCSIKNFNGLMLGFYGAYSFGGLLICLCVFIRDLLQNNVLYNTKQQYEGTLCALLIILALIFLNPLIFSILRENIAVTSKYGTHKAIPSLAAPFNEALEYLKNHSKDSDSLLVMPEGIMLNFLSGKSWDFYQTSFIPLDFDTFQNHNTIEYIALKKPQFIAFTSRNTSEYGKTRICRDYGVGVCRYVIDNYSLEAAFGEKFRIFIFKYLKEDMKNEEGQQ